MFKLSSQTFIFSMGLLVLSMSPGKLTTDFDESPTHWESEDSDSDSVSKSLDFSWLLRGLWGFLSFFLSSGLNYLSAYSQRYPNLLWVKMKFTNHNFFCFTKFISSSGTFISFNNLQTFRKQFYFYYICIIRGTLTSWNARIISKTTSIIFLRAFPAWTLIILNLFITHFYYNNYLGHNKVCYNRMK